MIRSSKDKSDSNLKVSVYWGDILYDTKLCQPNSSVTIGPKLNNTFILDLETSTPQDSIELVKVHGDTAELLFHEDLDGHLRLGKELYSLANAKASKHVTRDEKGLYHALLSDQDKADIVIGHVSFYIDWVKEKNVLPKTKAFSKKQLALLLLLLLFMVSIGVLVSQIVPTEPEKPPERLVTLLPRKTVAAKAAMGERKSATGGAQKGEAGKAAVTAVPEKPSAAQMLRKANLGSLFSGLSSLGSSAPKVDTNAKVVSTVAQESTGGFTTEGMKKGAGGKSVGIGRTVGQGEGGFEGTGRLGLSGNSAVEGSSGYGTGEGQVREGGLDRDVIESIIRRRQDRIRLCYERQLNFYPKLSGKIAVHFIIGKDGNVLSSTVTEDTMKNQSVKSCLLSEVKSWTFPRPLGGVTVPVDYPFVFESSARSN